MITVRMFLCGWCNGIRYESRGADGLPPGTYDAKTVVLKETCIPCGTRFSEGVAKGGVTKDDTTRLYRKDEEKKGC